MKKNAFMNLLEIVTMSIWILLVLECFWLMNEQKKKIEEQENRIQQQIELIDALQQGEEN